MCRKKKITGDLEVSGISKNGTPALKGMEKPKLVSVKTKVNQSSQ